MITRSMGEWEMVGGVLESTRVGRGGAFQVGGRGLARTIRWLAVIATTAFWLWAGLQINGSYHTARLATLRRAEQGERTAHLTRFGDGVGSAYRAHTLAPADRVADDETSVRDGERRDVATLRALAVRDGQWAADLAFLDDCVLFGGLALGLIALRWILWEMFPKLDL